MKVTICPTRKAKGYIPSSENYKSRKTPQSTGIDTIRLGNWDLKRDGRKKHKRKKK